MSRTSDATTSVMRRQRAMMYNQVASCPDMESEFLQIYEACHPYTMTSLERMYALYKSVKHLESAHISGDIVESGIWQGGSAMVCAMTLLQSRSTHRTIHLYDTFDGMPEPSDRDYDYAGNHASARLSAAEPTFSCLGRVDYEEVRERLLATGYPENRICFVKGRVEDTLPAHAPDTIALLRLDTDWYTSTRHELEHLYPKLSPGGVLLIDDYGHWRGSREAVDEYFQTKAHPILLNRIDYTGRIGVKP